MRTPKDDKDQRSIVDRIATNRELAEELEIWLLEPLAALEDQDLRCRCLLLLGAAIGRLHAAQVGT